eukprot:2544174-Pleurochrysis_carterae.AAC.1
MPMHFIPIQHATNNCKETQGFQCCQHRLHMGGASFVSSFILDYCTLWIEGSSPIAICRRRSPSARPS